MRVADEVLVLGVELVLWIVGCCDALSLCAGPQIVDTADYCFVASAG
jgi:hypothetical protein